MESEKVKEIKKALECCAFPVWTKCDKCPRVDEDSLCKYRLRADALTLINELESENERLKKTTTEKNLLVQFVERLKEKIENCSGCYIPDYFESPTNEFAYSAIEVSDAIDETLKEFIGE